MDVDGETIASVGGVASGEVGGGVELERVTVTVFDTWLPPDDAVTVMVLLPLISGMLAILHAVPAMVALPDAPDVALHVTDTVEVPPVTEPESATVVDVVLVVVDGGVGTTSTEPTSQAVPSGRTTPRWSTDGQLAPWSIAGELAPGSIVSVSPPFDPRAPRSGFVDT